MLSRGRADSMGAGVPFLRVLGCLALALGTAFSTHAAETVEELVAVDTGGLEARSAALILSGQEGGELEVHFQALPLPGGEVALWLEIPGTVLLAGVGSGDVLAEVYVYALGPEDDIVAYLTRAIRADPALYSDTLGQHALRFQGRLALPSGNWSLRLLVLQRESGRLALRVLPVVVPRWEDADRVVLPPLALEGDHPALAVRADTDQPSLFPLVVQGKALVPGPEALDPSQESQLYLLGRGLPIAPELVFQDGGGEERSRLEGVVSVGQTPAVVDALEAEILRLDLPATDLPPGSYRLRVAADGEDLAMRFLRLEKGEAPEEVSLDLAFDSRAVKEAADAAELAVPDLVRTEALYLGVLMQLAEEGFTPTVRAALQDFEVEHLAESGGNPKKVNRFLQRQVNVALRIAAVDPEALAALVALHEAQYRHYHAGKRFLLSTHCRNLLALIQRIYLDKLEGREAKAQGARTAALAMTSLGDYMLETGARLSAQKAFERALEHDEAQPAALLGVAGLDEVYGAYREAVDNLERLVEVLPGHGEGKLRLGVNLRRLGKVEEAERWLRRGMEEGVSDWIAILSYQELAELEYGTGRGLEAVELLREARERFPANQRLHIQLAALLDRLGRPAEARQALDQLNPQSGRDQDTPRLRYGEPSRWLALQSRRTLEERGEEQRQPLLSALEQILGKADHGSSR